MKKLLSFVLLNAAMKRCLLLMPGLLRRQLLFLFTALSSTMVMAHPGHVTDEAVHSFLHVEHVIMFAIPAVVFAVMVFWKK